MPSQLNFPRHHWITIVFSAVLSFNLIHLSVVLFPSDIVKFTYINKASKGSVWPMWLGSWSLNQFDSIEFFMTTELQQYKGMSVHNLISFPQPYQTNQWTLGFIGPYTALAQLTLLLKKTDHMKHQKNLGKLKFQNNLNTHIVFKCIHLFFHFTLLDYIAIHLVSL